MGFTLFKLYNHCTIILEHFLSSHPSPLPLAVVSSFGQATTFTYCLHKSFAFSGHFIWIESYNMWSFVSDFFHVA